MFDFEAARARLLDAASGGTSQYVACLRDMQPFGGRVFHWYPTEADLLESITDDFFSLQGEGEDESDLDQFVASVSELIAAAPKANRLSEALLQGVNSLLRDWSLEFVGTYRTLLNGDGAWERSLRAEFRESVLDDSDDDEEEADQDTGPEAKRTAADPFAPIGKTELKSFDSFVSTLPWE